MTLQNIRDRIKEIEKENIEKSDVARAHELEDMLYRDVLYAIKEGACETPPLAARLTLSVRSMGFVRSFNTGCSCCS